jgi:transcriptional regulator with XRE-family HTH domain
MTYGYYPEKLAKSVRAYRDSAGLTLRALAAQTQISPATLSRIENEKEGKFVPDTFTLITLANTCGFRLEDIFQGEDEAGKAQIQKISTQLRASKQVSSSTLQALEAVIRAVQQDRLPNQAS